jgi:hypothetical protein
VASESVKILIEAEDKASAQVANASKNIEQAVKGVKETGARAKGSIEFVGVMAGQLGGGQLQTAAQGVAAITEKVGQFSEVMKAGSTAAGFFQAGIMALVGAMSFNLGQSIGEAIFGVRDLNKELEDLTAQYQQQAEVMKQTASIKFGEQMEDLTLIKDPKKQQSEAAALFKAIEQQRDNAIKSAAAYDTQAQKILDTENKYLGKMGALSEADQDRANQLILTANNQRTLVGELDNELAQLSKMYGPRAKMIEQIKQQQKAEDEAAQKKKAIDDSALSSLRSINYQYIELTKGQEAARREQLKDQGMSDIQIDRILFAERALGVEKKLADHKRKAEEAEQSRLQKVADLRESELERLQEQKILLEQGEKAAHIFRLTQQGLDRDTAEAIANAQAASEQAAKSKQIQTAQPVAAVESRLLSRGPSQDKMSDIAKSSKATAEQTAAINQGISRLATEVAKDRADRAKREQLEITIAGRGA